ncbi:threonine synthase [Lactobacillus alvi]|uniref:Threonine synthase n=1 Tax=Limosilactobacillus alvi TaxID=990412 RepID=A0ABS2EMH6_9LACO|nr:threonine synthase [Limosilactobacillus alvi]MBM6753689.1 threonine synthase [Limosilactobacillus alvi]
MKFRSTRDVTAQATDALAAIIQGLAVDGGLFVPVAFPHPNYDLATLIQQPYQLIAQQVFGWFFNELSGLEVAATKAYGSQWDTPSITPLTKQIAGNYYLELFHGPTLAFKDVALQALPQLMRLAKEQGRNPNETIILTATSGDTGTAALRGFKNILGTQVVVFYPQDGISPIQKLQMLGQTGANLHVVGITGNFDQAQTRVKQIFNNPQIRQQLAQQKQQFSSANSMNIGRLIPQITYYFSAYGQLVRQGVIKVGEKINFSVPTGNFGDILAGYYAKKLGLPIHKLICASNVNHVLTDFFQTGTYDRQRKFQVTNAPSMDILVSSNLERLLFDAYRQDAEVINKLMQQLQSQGTYQVTPQVHKWLQATFAAGYATPNQVQAEIRRVYEQANYLIDPHTAVGSFVTQQYQAQTNDQHPCVILATASPYKFPETVLTAINSQTNPPSGLAAIETLAKFDTKPLTTGVKELFVDQPQSQLTIAPPEMTTTVLDLI